jgi:hypothetical protein
VIEKIKSFWKAIIDKLKKFVDDAKATSKAGQKIGQDLFDDKFSSQAEKRKRAKPSR